MSSLAKELRHSGYERTERESPFHDEGTLWTNSYELVCDKTAAVIRKSGDSSKETESTEEDFERHEYYHSHKVRMMGGYLSSYDWSDEDSFTY